MRVKYQVLDGIDQKVLLETRDEIDALNAAISHLEARRAFVSHPKVRFLELNAGTSKVRACHIYSFSDIPILQDRILDYVGARDF